MMQVMVVWKAVPGKYKTAIEQFLRTGGHPGPGAKTLGRWHVPGSMLGWHLFEVEDMGALAEQLSTWADLLELEAYPVVGDEVAGPAAKRALGK
jgi:Domain of unknown function (DUF3303)